MTWVLLPLAVLAFPFLAEFAIEEHQRLKDRKKLQAIEDRRQRTIAAMEESAKLGRLLQVTECGTALQ